MTFSGSFRAGEVEFLLKPLPLADVVGVHEKERLIQSGRRHYSEMLSPERLPSAQYRKLFRHARQHYGDRMAGDCLRLASMIADKRPGPITIVSLARAGTPVGVVVSRLLSTVFGRPTHHYSISIIRDRGIDQVALQYILAQGHDAESIVFVDGWTGKGVIAHALTWAVTEFNLKHGTAISTDLHVLCDLAGAAACAATYEDYLIPSSILNATISGLVSRSILNGSIGPGDFHGCYVYHELEPHDDSQPFADDLVSWATSPHQNAAPPRAVADRAAARVIARDVVRSIVRTYDVRDVNLVKPGIGEATRALLRRVPERVLLRDPDASCVAHLRQLAHEKHVPVECDPTLPYHAVSLIRWEPDE